MLVSFKMFSYVQLGPRFLPLQNQGRSSDFRERGKKTLPSNAQHISQVSGYLESTLTFTLQPCSGRPIRHVPSARISNSSW